MQDRETALSDVEQKELTYLLDKMLLEGFTAREREIARAVAELVFKHTAEWPRAALASPGDAPPQEPTGAIPQAEASEDEDDVPLADSWSAPLRKPVVPKILSTDDFYALLRILEVLPVADPFLTDLQSKLSDEERRQHGNRASHLSGPEFVREIERIEALIQSRLPAPVSPVEPTTCPKCRSNTRAYRLAVADVIDGRMAGMTSCRDEWHSRMPMVSPVEPEPPTTCRCLDCEPLTDPGPKPSEDDINRLEKAAWDSKTDLVLVWYRDRAEMFRQRLRETERAWQIDRKKPTVEPEPCVWRAIGVDECAPQCGRADDEIFSRYVVQEWQACPYCKSPLQLAGAPLKVER